MVYENCKIYGPYKRKDDRQHIIAVFSDGTKKTVSYPKYLTEKRLGRYFKPWETVDHKDGNFNNNDPSNIQVISRSRHAYEDCRRLLEQDFNCPICNKKFTLADKKLNYAVQNRKKGKAGPFCGKGCAGRYGTMIQNNVIKKLPVERITPKYYRLKGE